MRPQQVHEHDRFARPVLRTILIPTCCTSVGVSRLRRDARLYRSFTGRRGGVEAGRCIVCRMNTSHRSRPVRNAAVVLCLVLAAAGCGGDAGTDAAAVEIRDNDFQPTDLAVTTGMSVSWTNHDDVPHTVTFTDGEVESSDTLDEGDSFSTAFKAPGTYAYVCAVHPEMEATVTVTG